MSDLNPTLAGAVAKAERGIAFLKIPGATPDHLRSAMDCFKSAGKLAASHHTVLVELEDQVPEPGPALFDGTGQPAPGVPVQAPTSDEAILLKTGEDYDHCDFTEEDQWEEDLLFAARTHFRARGFDLDRWRDFKDQMERVGFDPRSWDWLVGQIREAGEFQWPHRCAGGCGELAAIDEDGTIDTCWDCTVKQRKADQKKEKAASKKKPAKNPLVVDPAPEFDTDEGGEA